MRDALVVWTTAIVLAIVAAPAGQAGGVHDGPEATATDMFIHFAGEDVLPVDPVEPSGAVLPPAPTGDPCEGPLQWTAASNRAPYAYDGGPVTWSQGLLRDARLSSDNAPVLTWYLETVQPGTSEPADIPAPQIVVEAEVRLGDAPAAYGKGAVLANGSTEPVLVHSLGDAQHAGVDGRHVYRFDVRLDWQAEALVPADEGFHIAITARQDAEACAGAPPHLRAYSAAGVRPALRWHVFDPVRVDLLEARAGQDGTDIVLHASSPWGAFDVLLGQATLRGPTGETALPVAAPLAAPGLALGWSLQSDVQNGTYRIDADVRNLQETAAAQADAVFRVGSTAPDPPPPATPTERDGQQTPWPVGATIAAIAIALVRRR